MNPILCRGTGLTVANIGITLRSARIQRGLTIEQVAQDTRISARFLEALESESFNELPAPVYVRGFLRSYATYLRLEPQSLLEQLDPSLGGGGPPRGEPGREPTPASGRRPDPFRPASPVTAPPLPSRPRFTQQDDDDGYDEYVAPVEPSDHFSARRAESETPLDTGYDAPYRRGRVGGVLVERGAVYEGSGGGAARLVALGGGALILLVVFAGLTMALTGGGDDDDTVQGGGNTTPASSGTGTVVVGGTRTRTPSASVTASATASASSTANAAATTTPGADATPTATAPGATATVTQTAAPDTPTPAPTPTPVPPTPTPVPTPPPPSHGSAFSECPDFGNGQPNCGSPMTVVCPPSGGWFVDYGSDYPASTYGWPFVVVNTNGQAITAGQGGCT